MTPKPTDSDPSKLNPVELNPAKLSRRNFLKGTAASALTLGFTMPVKGMAAPVADDQSAAINAFIRIDSANNITLIVNKPEMGQGTFTSLPMILAEELDAHWESITIEHAKLPSKDFAFIGAAGSSSVTGSFMALRTAGANTRALLVQAAAEHWNMPTEQLHTDNSQVINSRGETLSYGQLVAAASQLSVPKDVPLKPTDKFKLLGKDVRRTEAQLKITGRADFGIDARPANLHFAAIARPPIFGASLKSFDHSKAQAMPGVVKIKEIPAGVAVIADSFWRAKKTRDQLVLEWDLGDWQHNSTPELQQQYREQADKRPWRPKKLGNAGAARSRATTVLEMDYQLPFLAHSPMEPLNCTVHDIGDRAEVWTSNQFPTSGQQQVAKILGHNVNNVVLHNAFLGGGFGRRGATDYIQDAAHIAKGEPWPVKLVWTREEDVQGGYYRPMVLHRTRLSLDEKGDLTAFENSSVSQGSGINHISYAVINQSLASHRQELPVQTHFWRSVDNSHTAFVIESAIDEAAIAAGRDAIAYRRPMLEKQPRMVALLDEVEQMSDWGRKRPDNTGLGVAIHASFGSIVAQVAEVTVSGTNIKVDRVWCAVDCGFAVNPLSVRAQMESAIIYGLSAALFGEITFEKGAVQQSNFHDYQVVRMNHCPDIEVAIINSGADLGGIGEPGLPPIAPAVANAVFAATGQRLRSLPLRLST